MEAEIYTGVVLLDSQARIYLIKEDDKNQIGQNRWNLPGGSVDEKESIVDSAMREALEETGYQVEIKSLLGCYKAYKKGKSWLYIVFEARLLVSERTVVKDADVKEGRWFGKQEFMKMDISLIVHPDMKLVYKIAVEGRGFPLDSVKFINYDEQIRE